MLKQELESVQSQPLPISPREFAEAVAEIENKQSADQINPSHLNIDDAIKQLGINVKADEVLTVIQTRRATQIKASQQAALTRRKRIRAIVATILGLSLLSNLILLHSLNTSVFVSGPAAQRGIMHTLAGKQGTG